VLSLLSQSLASALTARGLVFSDLARRRPPSPLRRGCEGMRERRCCEVVVEEEVNAEEEACKCADVDGEARECVADVKRGAVFDEVIDEGRVRPRLQDQARGTTQ
jgi:hypothetical protein